MKRAIYVYPPITAAMVAVIITVDNLALGTAIALLVIGVANNDADDALANARLIAAAVALIALGLVLGVLDGRTL